MTGKEYILSGGGDSLFEGSGCIKGSGIALRIDWPWIEEPKIIAVGVTGN